MRKIIVLWMVLIIVSLRAFADSRFRLLHLHLMLWQ
jgi:hypothetical protein